MTICWYYRHLCGVIGTHQLMSGGNIGVHNWILDSEPHRPRHCVSPALSPASKSYTACFGQAGLAMVVANNR